MKKPPMVIMLLALAFTSSLSRTTTQYKEQDCYYTFIVAEISGKAYISNVFNTCEFIIDKDKGTRISKKLYNSIVQTLAEKYNVQVSTGISDDIVIYLGKSDGFQKYIPYEKYIDAKNDLEAERNHYYLNRVDFQFK